ncbi:MAG: hypothetical protein JRJ12_03290 [Deltaproteobacteria bacterium]|nr:hypothetical protein [Deltaproteobacteria bacterium]MBW2069709.1 hypothetical protein [Deltaproteobacteria bacterium]
MSSTASMGGVIAEGVKVEKLQEIQQQTPEWQKRTTMTAAEQERSQKQKQVRKSAASDQNLAISERQAHNKGKDERHKKNSKDDGSEGEAAASDEPGRFIDIVV